MRVIIAGSRHIVDRRMIWDRLDDLFVDVAPHTVLSGLANGPDTIGLWWAVHHGYRVEEFPADWSSLGRRAGFVRNRRMALLADALVAFYDGVSRGTRMMVDLARKHGLNVRIVRL